MVHTSQSLGPAFANELVSSLFRVCGPTMGSLSFQFLLPAGFPPEPMGLECAGGDSQSLGEQGPLQHQLQLLELLWGVRESQFTNP